MMSTMMKNMKMIHIIINQTMKIDLHTVDTQVHMLKMKWVIVMMILIPSLMETQMRTGI